MTTPCTICHAHHWKEGWITTFPATRPKFSSWCRHGQVLLPPLQAPPQPLNSLLTDITDPDAKLLRERSRAYNSSFKMATSGADYQGAALAGGVQMLRMQGTAYHKIGTVFAPNGQQPKFAQVYVYDSAEVRC
jgi:hypothetical protein